MWNLCAQMTLMQGFLQVLWFRHQLLFHQFCNLLSGTCTMGLHGLSINTVSPHCKNKKDITFRFVAGVPLTPPKLGTWGQPGKPHADGSISPPPPAAGTPMISSVAKVVQPTATVSSVPVCGPSK